jgi:hypothetical protein
MPAIIPNNLQKEISINTLRIYFCEKPIKRFLQFEEAGFFFKKELMLLLR